ncbi:MAG: ABC transporter substrate-binding protein [Candidatus Viridilinea halotolerans]|uniref:ABC transporter substrate-binding protein n=1 Tax=Candidatus Viridilinea halotolerans TaxID=2491704 RepID=A0A426TQP0_9CHLR|nr:MAG: ABC transporter substrate-binding protein [Candidatus Viridilinea halotolerans]
MSDQEQRLHPGVLQAQEQLRQGRISRREFLRLATLLGAGFTTATVLAACGGEQQAAPPPPPPAGQVEEPVDPAPAAAGAALRGGTLRMGVKVQAVDHPARFSWTESSNLFRATFEYLTETDEQNITHPHLLESWEASDDLMVWTLTLRQGIMWSNGDELVADHVIYNFGEWLNPDVGSSILGLWEGSLTTAGIEKVDEYTVRLNLDRPKLDVPESLYHYPALIMHPSFDGDISSGANPYTGAYRLVEYVVNERARFERQENYWQMGADGTPLPYLDALEFIGLGDDQTAYVSALQTGEIHTFYEPSANSVQSLRNDANLKIYTVDTSQARVLRMRVDQAPYDDVRVRQALRKAQDREMIMDIAAFGEGLLGHDVHISPVQPEFAPMDLPEYDPEGARALLVEAGYADGIDMSVAVGTGWTDVVAYAESLQQTAQPAGINLTLDTMPNTSYWDLWTETPLGITPWTHRPLAVMLLPLAYTADAEGNPVPWNETRWVDDEFSALLVQAQGTLDIEARRVLMADLQRIMHERGPVAVAWWQRVWEVYNPAFQGVYAHPTLHTNYFRDMWYDPSLDPFI